MSVVEPICQASDPCARAASGHAAAAPPSSVMNERRFMSDMGSLPHRPPGAAVPAPSAYHGAFITSVEQT
jgi:hypothetical protein